MNNYDTLNKIQLQNNEIKNTSSFFENFHNLEPHIQKFMLND